MSFNPKNKAVLIAALSIRSTAVDGGGEIPDDEMQCDLTITDGSKDSYGSMMTEKTMRNYVEDCNNGIVPFMRDHSSEVNQQLGRIVHATYEEAEKRVIATASLLRDTDETPENMRINEYLRRIEKRFYTGVSVAFRDAKETCNIRDCGKEIFDYYSDSPCPHIPKRFYNGEECTYDVDDARLREVSLVATPSNPNAKLYDTRQWGEDMRKHKLEGDLSKGETDPKSLLEREGLKYRSALIDEALAEGVRAEDDFDEDKWRAWLDKAESDQIIAQTNSWRTSGNAKWGEGGRKTADPHAPIGGGSDTVIILPPSAFEF